MKIHPKKLQRHFSAVCFLFLLSLVYEIGLYSLLRVYYLFSTVYGIVIVFQLDFKVPYHNTRTTLETPW